MILVREGYRYQQWYQKCQLKFSVPIEVGEGGVEFWMEISDGHPKITGSMGCLSGSGSVQTPLSPYWQYNEEEERGHQRSRQGQRSRRGRGIHG